MKAKTNFYLFLFLVLLVSCSKAQEKTPQLSTHDKNLINKKIDNKNFKIDYVKKTDSIQNVKTALHFDENLNLYEKQVEKYGDNKKLLLSSIYKPEKENKNILVLHSEKKYTYADGLTKENTIVWKNNKEFGYTFVEKYFNKILDTLTKAKIRIDGLFLNADAGFDSKELRDLCKKLEIFPNIAINQRNGTVDEDIFIDELLYEERYCIERTNAWMDSFRTLLNRFDVTASSWMGFNLIGFTVILLKKINKNKKSR